MTRAVEEGERRDLAEGPLDAAPTGPARTEHYGPMGRGRTLLGFSWRSQPAPGSTYLNGQDVLEDKFSGVKKKSSTLEMLGLSCEDPMWTRFTV